MNESILNKLFREAIHDVAAPQINLKDPKFWYQNIVFPIYKWADQWVWENIQNDNAVIERYFKWPYPISPRALEEYDIADLHVELKIMHFEFDGPHLGWDITGGSMYLGDTSSIEIKILIDPYQEISSYKNSLSGDLIDVIAHEIHHQTQEGPFERLNVPIYLNITSNDTKSYFLQCDEKPAFIIGFRARAQLHDKSVKEIMRNYLENYVRSGAISNEDLNEILYDWLNYEFN